MKKQQMQIATKSEAGIVATISRSTVLQPKICFKGGSIKWFDDAKLIRK